MRFKLLFISAIVALVAATACDTDTTKPESEAPEAEESTTETDGEEKAEADDSAGAELPLIAKGPIAKVNGKEIPAADFNKEVERLARMAQNLPAAAIEKFKTNTVDRLIDQEVVEAKLDSTEFEASDEEVNKELEDFKSKMGGPEGVARFFEQSGLTEDELKSDIARSIVLKKFLREEYGLKISDDKIKEYYDSNMARFTQEEQVKASHILVKVEKDASKEAVDEKHEHAKNLYKQATADGADFAALAKEHSEGPTGPRGGDLGFFSKKRMVPEFSEAAFKAKPGDVTGPVKTEFGYHIIKVTDRKSEKVSTFDEVKDEIRDNLERTEMRESMEKLVKELREGAEIETLADNIEKNPDFKPAQQQRMGMPGMGGMGGGHPPIPKGGAAPTPKPTK